MEHIDGPVTPAGGTDLQEREHTDLDQVTDHGWNAILLNDPVNLFDYVIVQLSRIFEMDPDTAARHAYTAHQEGRAAVFHGSKDDVLTKVEALGAVGLWASAERAA